jgi:hypothetical protein
MRANLRTGAALLIVMAVLAACGAPADDAASDTTAAEGSVATATTLADTTTTVPDTSTLVPAPTVAPTKPPGTTIAPPGGDFEPGDDPVAYATADLAVRLGIAEADITLELQEEVTWRDGSLGCPLPGFEYTQALVDGSRIVLVADGVAYPYHSSAGRSPFLCEQDIAPVG